MEALLKRPALLFSLFLIAAAISSATPVACSTVSPTLNNFELLGAGGCSVGNLIFSNFADTATSSDSAYNISASSIAVGLITDPEIGLNFRAAWGIGNTPGGASQFQDEVITFVVSTSNATNLLADVGLDFNGSATGTGLTSVVETYCPGAASVVGCVNAGQISLTNPPLNLSVEAPFTFNTNMVAIRKDFSLISGPSGTTVISNVDQTFSQIPEPGTLLLMGSALAGLGLYRFRRA